MHGVGFSKSSSSRRSMSLLSPMYTHVHPVPSTYTPDVLGVFARMPFLVNGHTCVPAHGGIAASCLSRCFGRTQHVAINALRRPRCVHDRALQLYQSARAVLVTAAAPTAAGAGAAAHQRGSERRRLPPAP